MRKLRTLLALPFAAFAVIVVRLLRPLILVRFGRLATERLGHLAIEPAVYLCEREHSHRAVLDVFYHSELVCNEQLRRMWARILRVSSFAQLADRLNRRIPGWRAHVLLLGRHAQADPERLLDSTPGHLAFTEDEEHRGREARRALGIPDDAPFICFINRDPAYLESRPAVRDWRYHDYRDSSITPYVAAAEALTQRGYFAVRMGAVVREPLASNNPRIIDYATTARSDFLDVYLAARCRFVIAPSSGFAMLALAFRKPLVMVNIVPFSDMASFHCSGNIHIPKKYWARDEDRWMTFREIAASALCRAYGSQHYAQVGVELIENTESEIRDAAIEMEERLKGDWHDRPEDEQMQDAFWTVLGVAPSHRRARIGTKFLRQNCELLQ